MANRNAAMGLIPMHHLTGGMPSRLRAYAIASALAQDIFTGDPVVMTGTTNNITIATAGADNPVLGAFAGVRYVDSRGSQQFSPFWASGTVGTNIEALVYDDPYQVYEIQVNGIGIAAADVGANANLVAGAGSQVTGRSGWQLNATGINTTINFQCRILQLSRRPGNVFGQFSKAYVQIQRPLFGHQPSAGV